MTGHTAAKEQMLALTNALGGPAIKTDICLLSLDGGGVKGLSSLRILEKIMTQVNASRERRGQSAVKPCELFDLIGGTSTGG
jgi:patatin-like phospholipase/acyl hydrolase